MSTFITKLPAGGTGTRLAVKDLIDVEGIPTTAGCRAVARAAAPAAADAPCLAGARAAGARIVGKTNLHELAYGTAGTNPWYGTPVNPLDPGLVPGGSSSGSAVAVAVDDADVALGSDTGGSIRIPAACCGIAGLKTTHGRIPLDGVWPLAPSLDTVGPMARDVAGLVLGMQLLEPGFTPVPASDAPRTIGRFRGLAVLPVIDASVDEALLAAGLEIVDVDLPGWAGAFKAVYDLMGREAWQVDGALYEQSPDGIGEDVRLRLEEARQVTEAAATRAREVQRDWQAELADVFRQVEAVALPTLVRFPPAIGEMPGSLGTATSPVNLAGVPALALPVPTGGRLPASLQLVGPPGHEASLLTVGALVEEAVGPVV